MSQNGRPTMSGRELRKIRERLGLTLDDFAIELGYEGSQNGNRTTIKRFENGERPISLPVAKLAFMLAQFGIPKWPQHLEAEPAKDSAA
jgi:transcriptional regulator with XRE-family HTH domain